SVCLRDYENELKYPSPWVRGYGIDTLDGLHLGNSRVEDLDTFKGQREVLRRAMAALDAGEGAV
ncbi:MAG: hypothetical protein OXE50_08615, partial [Chloroflexi bacterium]|nr:hypothetical protein [Chloroflexota bacterium]